MQLLRIIQERIAEKQYRIRVSQKSAKMLDFQRIVVFSGLSDRNVSRVDGQRR